MSEHKFVYTVSGIHLSDEHKLRISQAIASAVAGELTGDAPGEVSADNLSLLRIYGGIWWKVAVPGTEGQDPVLNQVGQIAETRA